MKRRSIGRDLVSRIGSSNIMRETMMDASGHDLLLHEGLNPRFAPAALKSVEVCHFNRIYKGVGIRNRVGGLEFYCSTLSVTPSFNIPGLQSRRNFILDGMRDQLVRYRSGQMTQKECLSYFHKQNQLLANIDSRLSDLHKMGDPSVSGVTIGLYGVTFLPFVPRMKGKVCCLFSNLHDYIAFTMTADSRKHLFSSHCDCLVMNSVVNFVQLMLDSEDYDHVYCFFPDTVLGRTMESTVLGRNRHRAHSARSLYEGCVSLHQYVRNNLNKE